MKTPRGYRFASRQQVMHSTAGLASSLGVIAAALVGLVTVGIFAAFARPLDFGHQHAEAIAEVAALGAAMQLPDEAAARQVAFDLIAANQQEVPGPTVTCDAQADITVYHPQDTTPLSPPFDKLGPDCMAVTVRTRTSSTLPVRLGESVSAKTVVWGPAVEASVDPIYVIGGGPLEMGKSYVCTYLEDPSDAAESEAGFGWIRFSNERAGDEKVLLELLRGEKSVEPASKRFTLRADNIIAARGSETAANADGLAAWRQALVGDEQHPGRLYQAAQKPYCDQTIEQHSSRHPRLLTVPIVAVTERGLQVQELRALWLVDAEVSGPGPARITLQPVKHTLSRGKVAPAAKSSMLYARQLLD